MNKCLILLNCFASHHDIWLRRASLPHNPQAALTWTTLKQTIGLAILKPSLPWCAVKHHFSYGGARAIHTQSPQRSTRSFGPQPFSPVSTMFTAPKKKSNRNPATKIQPTQSLNEPLEGGVKIFTLLELTIKSPLNLREPPSYRRGVLC